MGGCMVDGPDSRPRILVVDDEEGVREVVARILERAGFTVILAPDGTEALARFATDTTITAAIVDLSLPGLDGAQVAASLREARPGIGILLMSGFEYPPDVPGSGRTVFIRKPFMPDELRGRVRELLA